MKAVAFGLGWSLFDRMGTVAIGECALYPTVKLVYMVTSSSQVSKFWAFCFSLNSLTLFYTAIFINLPSDEVTLTVNKNQ